MCGECGSEYGKWQGKCDVCGQWNTIKEFRVGKARKSKMGVRVEVKSLNEYSSDVSDKVVFSSGIKELDRVLGKGIVRGSVILLAGEPGIGKSTLFTQSIGKIGGLYVAGEESGEQVMLRAKRLGVNLGLVAVMETNDIESIIDEVERTKNVYKVIVVDSIQMMTSNEEMGAAGSVSQIRASTYKLIELAKRKRIAVVIIGHITKTGEIAGPKLLEHMVDVVLNFEGEKNGEIRLVRCRKNRFGGSDEVGFFRMSESGLKEMGAGELGGLGGEEKRIGSALSVVVEGNRPILVEVQALVTTCQEATPPKRVFRGIDFSRGQLLVAVCQKSLGIPLYKYDVYVTISGGIRVSDPSLDLAIVGALYSSYKSMKIGRMKKNMVLVGEVSLLGGVKKILNTDRRIREIKRMDLDYGQIGDVKELRKLVTSNQ